MSITDALSTIQSGKGSVFTVGCFVCYVNHSIPLSLLYNGRNRIISWFAVSPSQMKRTCLHHASEVLKTRTSLFLFVSALCTDIQYPVCIPHDDLHHTTIPDQWFLDNQDELPPFTIIP